MRKIWALLIFVSVTFSLRAQTVDENCVDGVLYFQLKPEFPMDMLTIAENGTVDTSRLAFLSDIFQKYGVYDVCRPFNLFGNEQLLRVMEVHFDRMYEIGAFIEELSKSLWISYAERVPLFRPLYKVNDPYYGNVNNRNWKWYLDMIKADSAWDIQTGSSHVKVAVVDNYVWGEHPDLQIDSANMCAVGYDRTQGYTYAVGTAAPPASEIPQESSEDAYSASHGTHCAGLVGAINNNRIGVASIGGGVTLMGVSATTSQYVNYIMYGVQGVQWAAMSGAKVISMSFGSSTASQTQQLVMQTCHDAGIVLLASAGNEGDEDNSILYPAGYSSVISVASVDGDGKLSYFSQWGPGRADIAAPGGFISSSLYYPNMLSTTYCKSYVVKNMGFSGTYYDGMQGTSMACPVAAGLVGLLLSKDSTLTPDAVKTRLQQTAIPLPSASVHTIDGYGYINAYAALLYEYLIVSRTEIDFPKKQGYVDSLVVNASKPWTLSGLPSWLSASCTSGDSGTTTIVLTTLSENETAASRSAVLTFTGTGKTGSKTVKVTQSNYDFRLNISPRKIVFSGKKGLYDTLHVSSVLRWSMQTGNNNWLATDIQAITPDSSIIVLGTRSANTTGGQREVCLVFSASGIPNDTVWVVQRMADFITLSTAIASMDGFQGAHASLMVYSNVQWQVKGGDSSWIVPEISGARDTAELIFTSLSDNRSGDVRSAAYTITNGTINKGLTIKQYNNLSILITDEDANWQVYPNPASEQVFCRMGVTDAAQACLYDVYGRLLQSVRVEAETAVFQLEELPAGVYFIRCGNHQAQVVKQ